MRIIVLYDLPTTSSSDLREYRKFRKYLINEGFLMIQESVYSKLALNHSTAKKIIKNLKENKPKKGSVVALTVTEKQYNSMELIVGEYATNYIDSTDRIVII